MLVADDNDPLQLRPNPENLISKVRMNFLLHQTVFKENISYQRKAWEGGNRVCLVLNQLSESEESDAEEKKTEKAAPSGGRKYIPPKIAPMHYGKVTFLFYYCCYCDGEVGPNFHFKWYEECPI